MKNKYKAAGILNVILGVVELLGVLFLLGAFLILFLIEGEAAFLFLGFIFGIPLLIFCAPAIAHFIFMITTGVKMASDKEKDPSLKTAIWVNVGFKFIFVYSGIVSLYAMWDGSREKLISLITTGLFSVGVLLLSIIMDIVALLRKNKA